MKTSILGLPTAETLVYKFGCRLDPECLPIVTEQITLARRLYNDLVADMQKALNARSAHEYELAGAPAQSIRDKIEALNTEFAAARASNDESAMKAIATQRRTLWVDLSLALKSVRAEHKAELRKHLARIGRNSECTTYQLRSHYVAEGLGWATANQVLDSALQAFDSTIKKGRAPRFAIGSEITRDTLSLQFTGAGGVDAQKLLQRAHNEFKLGLPPQGVGRRSYGAFEMRMGPAKADKWATGTWQAHRPIPAGAHVGAVTLVREKVGGKFIWNIQLMLKLPTPLSAPVGEKREPLAALHLGWSTDSTGRRIGAIASAADPGLASIIQLPPEIESRLRRSSDIQSTRDEARDAVVPLLKQLPSEIVSGWPQELQEEFVKLKRLPSQHVAPSRLHRLWWSLHRLDLVGADLDFLTKWRSVDRIAHQSAVGLARSARGMRKNFYRNLALRQCQQYEAIVLDQPDLKEAALKINEASGERNELGAMARSGRVVAALYEYVAALTWAAAKCSTTLISVGGDSASVCSHCGNIGLQTVEGTQYQQQVCPSCSAVVDRKCNAAAGAYQLLCSDVEAHVQASSDQRAAAAQAAEAKKVERQAKLLESRKQRAAQRPPSNANGE